MRYIVTKHFAKCLGPVYTAHDKESKYFQNFKKRALFIYRCTISYASRAPKTVKYSNRKNENLKTEEPAKTAQYSNIKRKDSIKRDT